MSPDGDQVAFVTDGSLFKVSMNGGPPAEIGEGPIDAQGASWGDTDQIIFGSTGGLYIVNGDGGTPSPLTIVDADASQASHRWPDILLGGDAVLFTIISTGPTETAQIAALRLGGGEYEMLIPGGSNPRYVATGHIIYVAQGKLWAVAFYKERLEPIGAPVPVVDDLITWANGAGLFAVALDGSLLYARNISGTGEGGTRTLVWVDRRGRQETVNLPPRIYHGPRISGDGTRAAFHAPDGAGTSNVWISI